MDRIRIFAVFGIAFFMFGCPARSLFPLFADKDIVFNTALVGTWAGKDDEQTFSFKQSGEKGYTVTMRDENGEEDVYAARLGRLGKSWFIDSSPVKDGRDFHLISTHLTTKIQLEGDTLRMSLLESDWLREMIDAGKINVPHVFRDNEIILTATTKELQALVLRYAEDDKAFPDPIVLVRVK